MGERMSIKLTDVLHVAELAELAVRESELGQLVEQMNRIVDYVATLDEVPGDPAAEPFLAGPKALSLRQDVEAAVPLVHPPSAMAPDFRQGFFLVPRHGAMEDQ
jgi:aspartyl-tRNA(Asn)/glutamyl-tRNA(Gln) amidotransferase subunit C